MPERDNSTQYVMRDRLNDDLWLFHLAFRALTRLPDAELARHGLSRIHNRILFVIARAGEISVGALADDLDVTRQGLHAPMRELKDAGLINSRASEANRTIQLVSLTDEGKSLEYSLNEVQRKHMWMAMESAGRAGDLGWRKVMRALSEITPS